MLTTRKIIINVLLAIVLIGVTVTSFSCAKKRKLTVMYVKIWADSLNNTFEGICKEWGKATGVEVNMVQVSLNDQDTKTAALIESGTGADLAIFPAHQIAIYKDRLRDLDDIARELESNYGGFYDIARDMTFLDGHWYGIPLYAWSHLIVYRKDLLETHNLKPAKTFEDLASVAKKLNDPKNEIWGLGIGMGKDDDIAMFFQSLLWAFGGKVFESDGKTVAINSPETRKALQYLIDLYRQGVIPPGAFGWDGASNNKNFLAGKIAITANSPTIYYVAKHENPDMAPKILHTIYPTGPNGTFCYATGFTFATLKGNKNTELVKNLIRYIFKRENYSKLISSGEGSVDPWIRSFENLEIWKDPNLEPGLRSLDIMKSVGWPGPVTRSAAEVFQRRILTDILGRVINDKQSLDKAIEEAENKIKDIVAQYAK